MVANSQQNDTESPSPRKSEVGEIDISPPFKSVKDAVTLFGEGAIPEEKPAIKIAKPYSAEKILAKETQLHLAQESLNKLEEQLKKAETTKADALVELEKAKTTVNDLTKKLKALSESREQAIEAMEAAKSQAKQLSKTKSGRKLDGIDGVLKEELETTVKEYASVISELDDAKKELGKIRQDYNSSLEERVSAFKQAKEAEDEMKANTDRASDLSREIAAVSESIEQLKLASMQEHQQEAKVSAEEVVLRQSYKATFEESRKKLCALKTVIDPESTKNLELQLTETVSEIEALQKEMENKKTLDLDSVKSVTFKLDDAQESLQNVAEEEISLRSLVETLKLELENVKRERSKLKEKESETESMVGNLHVKLHKSKCELEACFSEESKVRGESEEMISSLDRLSSETKTAQREAVDAKTKAVGLKKEAEVTKLSSEDAEKKLSVALEEAEAAKTAEASALDHIKVLSEKTSAARSLTSESNAKITISTEEFESLSHKVEESDKLSEMKVAAALAQVEAVKASENEALQRLEVTQKEIECMKTSTQEALKTAEMAEAARKIVESELQRWREREQKKKATSEAVASQILLAETQVSSESSPLHFKINQKQNPSPKTVKLHKLEKEKVSSKKVVLLHNLRSIFRRKKNRV